MSVRDLVPWPRANDRDRNLPAAQEAAASPLFTLHREMNRLFDDVFRGFDTPSGWGGRGAWPQLEVQDADSEYRVTAELPGLEEKDVEVLEYACPAYLLEREWANPTSTYFQPWDF